MLCGAMSKVNISQKYSFSTLYEDILYLKQLTTEVMFFDSLLISCFLVLIELAVRDYPINFFSRYSLATSAEAKNRI